MARAVLCVFAFRIAAAVLIGGALGGYLGIAAAQNAASGWLNTDCAGRCVANGYDAKFCSEVCWVPDPEADAAAERLDWKCIAACGERGGTARACMATCRR